MDEEQVARIDDASMSILEEVGVVFRDKIALEDWKRAGADVRNERVHLDRNLIRELISTIPTGWTYRARNPERSLPFGGKHSIFVPMTGAPFIRDLEDVRRWPTIADLNMFHKLAHMSPALHSTAHHIVEPMDMVVSHRHLAITYSSMKYSDKTFMGMTTSGKNAEDVMDMCEILFGKDDRGNTRCNRELQWQFSPRLGRDHAFGDACLLPPKSACFVLAIRARRREHASLSRPGRCAAECRSVVGSGVYASYPQGLPGHLRTLPFHRVYEVRRSDGGNTRNLLMNYMIGQMARHYNVPWRTSNLLGGAKTFDAQAGYESAMTMNAVLHAGANYIWHSAGWNEAGMHCSVAKFVVDAEMCAMGYRMAEGVRWDDFDEALPAVRDVGPGGHYLGHPHTQANFQRAFFMPKLFNNDLIEQWQADGSVEITGRALQQAKRLLDEYQEPKLDPGIDEALRDYIERRKREIPAVDELNTTH